MTDTLLTERARKATYRNRPRFNQSEMRAEHKFKDSKGSEYVKWSNGMVTKYKNS